MENWQSRIFEKISWFGDIREKVSKLAQNETLSYLVGWLVGNVVFSETALRVFLIFCMKFRDYKGGKVTEPDFWKKFVIWRYSRKGLQISPRWDNFIFGWLVCNAVFSETALRICLIFCMNIRDYKVRKVTEPDIWKKFLIWRYSRKGLQISPK